MNKRTAVSSSVIGPIAIAVFMCGGSHASAQNPEIRFPDGPLPMGSTPGVRYERLVIQNSERLKV